MPAHLTLRKGSSTAEYTIADSGLVKKTTNHQIESEFHFPFEQITTNRIAFINDNKVLLTLGIVSASFGMMILIPGFFEQKIDPMPILLFLLIAGVLFFFYFRLREHKINVFTSDNKIIDFRCDKEMKDVVNTFITELIEKRNIYLLSKYGQLTKNVEYTTQLNNLNWLLNNRAILKPQYDQKITELNALFNSQGSVNAIGFKAGS